jgi:hypothetical protein
MLAYVKTAPRWQAGQRRRYYVAEHRWTLMGLDYLTQRMWRDDHVSLVREMHGEYKAWAAQFLGDPDAVEHFVEFVKKPTARSLLDEALVRLREATATADQWFWTRREDLPRHLAELLDYVLRTDATVLQREPTASAFRELLQRLVERQVPVALALADRLAGALARRRGRRSAEVKEQGAGVVSGEDPRAMRRTLSARWPPTIGVHHAASVLPCGSATRRSPRAPSPSRASP